MWEEIVKAMAARGVFGSEDRIVGVTLLGDGALVETEIFQWLVEPAGKRAEAGHNLGFTLYDVRDYIAVDPPLRPQGVAILSDGTLLRLTEETEMQEFWEKAGGSLTPLELAELLAAYAGDGPALRRSQNLVRSREDLADLVPARALDAIPGFGPLRHIALPDGSLPPNFSFWTYFLGAEPPDNIIRVGLNCWQVWAVARRSLPRSERRRLRRSAQPLLFWSVRSLAGGLDSPFYAGQQGGRSRETKYIRIQAICDILGMMLEVMYENVITVESYRGWIHTTGGFGEPISPEKQEAFRQQVWEGLKYCLNNPDFDYDGLLYEAALHSFGNQKKARQLYLLIWEEFFGAEEWRDAQYKSPKARLVDYFIPVTSTH